MEKSILQKIVWQGNSKKMFDVIMSNVPKFMKNNIQKTIEQQIIERKIDVATEDLIINLLEEVSPKPFSKVVMPIILGMKSE